MGVNQRAVIGGVVFGLSLAAFAWIAESESPADLLIARAVDEIDDSVHSEFAPGIEIEDIDLRAGAAPGGRSIVSYRLLIHGAMPNKMERARHEAVDLIWQCEAGAPIGLGAVVEYEWVFKGSVVDVSKKDAKDCPGVEKSMNRIKAN